MDVPCPSARQTTEEDVILIPGADPMGCEPMGTSTPRLPRRFVFLPGRCRIADTLADVPTSDTCAMVDTYVWLRRQCSDD